MKKLLLFTLALLSTLVVSAQEPPAQPGDAARSQDPWVSATFADFRLRSIGPAIMSGRIGSIAVHPESKQTWYLGVSSGGVWKTTNAGITFTPIFENEGSYSVGTVVIDSKIPARSGSARARPTTSAVSVTAMECIAATTPARRGGMLVSRIRSRSAAS